MRPTDENNAKHRRFFLQNSLGFGAVAASTALFNQTELRAEESEANRPLPNGDVAILRFLAAAELIETDLWQQYSELGGVAGGTPNAYQAALSNLDDDAGQYITSNTLDEQSHADFLNAYLVSKGATPVDLDRFRTLPSSQATGAQQIGRLTNLTQLSVDTSWYTRYRSSDNPDFGASFPQALPALLSGRFTAIPRDNSDFGPADHIQAIANTAAFHFGLIEQGGSSLYATLAHKVTSLQVLRIVVSIGGDEVAHFLEWVDFAGNGVSDPIAPVTDPITGLTFPDFNATGNPLLQTNLIFPVPCEFINSKLPRCAIIRPTAQNQINAIGAAKALQASGLFTGQSSEFLDTLLGLAIAADAARREDHF